MKFPISNFRFLIGSRSGRAVSPLTADTHGVTRPALNRQSSIVNRQSRQGVALVITLIMLSVTLVMALAFIAVANRERNAVTTTTDTTTARLAAESALAAVQAQVVANITASGGRGAFNYGLLVSTNYINRDGYNGSGGPFGFGPANPTNVSYFYPNGNLVEGEYLEQNIANLWFLPRAPVFVKNPTTGASDFRFYLDLNRNANFEANGQILELDNHTPPNVIGTNFNAIGDPEWIGVLERPDQPHGPNNKFVSRYTFVAQPIGNSLDLNFIHNQVFNTGLGNSDGYFRNEGVGSWELNLPALLADLNTNLWGQVVGSRPDSPVGSGTFYQFNQPVSTNSGHAFDDARALVAWRYNNSYNNLAVPTTLLPALADSGIDGYTLGNLMTTTLLPSVNLPGVNTPWAGSENPNRFFSLPSDLFDMAKTTIGVPPALVFAGNDFADRLRVAGNGTSTYDRYTFYRLLEQLGTDAAADEGKMNLNYRNVTNGVVVAGMETNLYPWAATEFFTNAADRLVRHYSDKWRRENYQDYTNTFGATTTGAFGVDRIPVYVGGRMVYSPAVNRLLQLAANLYDASTNRSALLGKDYPSVFRPTFLVTNESSHKNIYIIGYLPVVQVSGISDPVFLGTSGFGPLDATGLAASRTDVVDDENIYGVPWIIGAKKGFPAFNQLYMRNLVEVTRKLQVGRDDRFSPGATRTNQMLLMSITNRIGFSFWNAYNTDRAGNWTVYVRDMASMTLSNSSYSLPLIPFAFATNFAIWPGSAWSASGYSEPHKQAASPQSFVSGFWDYNFMPPQQIQLSSGQPVFVPLALAAWEPALMPPLFPRLALQTTNRVQAIILDGSRVVDYVQLFGPNGSRSVADEISDMARNGTGMWNTNLFSSGSLPTYGVVNQIEYSKLAGNAPGSFGGNWRKPPGIPAGVDTPKLAAQYFNDFFYGNGIPITVRGQTYILYNTNFSMQVPYTPTRYAWDLTLWQANDPLVHYLASDLRNTSPQTGTNRADDLISSSFTDSNPKLNTVPDRYQPWGRNAQMSTLPDQLMDASAFSLSYRDPLVWNSDHWDFPTGKYPSTGWLGRVHRGTPWQTVYLKDDNILTHVKDVIRNVGYNTWANWTGNTALSNGRLYDSPHMAPVEDRDLFDLFTTRFNDSSAQGFLSVNQTQLAAWSAALSGIVVLTNITADPISYAQPVLTNIVISPAGPAGDASALGQIVNGPGGINASRSGFGGVFEQVGDILSVPALTTQSPFLNRMGGDRLNFDLSDEVYEWVPQQLLGLLRVSDTPRYVIYGYGQTLKPAPDGTVLNGTFFKMVTNYQVVAESALRAVIRVDRNVTTNTVTGARGTNYSTRVESYNVLPPN